MSTVVLFGVRTSETEHTRFWVRLRLIRLPTRWRSCFTPMVPAFDA